MNLNGDWYCPNCGYLSDTQVTKRGTCLVCFCPVLWHEADKPGRTEELESQLATAQAEVREWGSESERFRAALAEIKDGKELTQSDGTTEWLPLDEWHSHRIAEGALAADHSISQSKVDAAQAEVRELRHAAGVANTTVEALEAELARVWNLVGEWEARVQRSSFAQISEHAEGRREGYDECAAELRAALSQPAKQSAPEDDHQLRMILHAYETGVGHGQQGRGVDFKDEDWGNADLAFAYRQGVRQGEKGEDAAEQPATPDADLPLIARRNGMLPTDKYAFVSVRRGDESNHIISSSSVRSTREKYQEVDALGNVWTTFLCHIADKDEDGLPVIERSELGPKYRYRIAGTADRCTWQYVTHIPDKVLKMIREGRAEAERFEDYFSPKTRSRK